MELTLFGGDILPRKKGLVAHQGPRFAPSPLLCLVESFSVSQHTPTALLRGGILFVSDAVTYDGHIVVVAWLERGGSKICREIPRRRTLLTQRAAAALPGPSYVAVVVGPQSEETSLSSIFCDILYLPLLFSSTVHSTVGQFDIRYQEEPKEGTG